MKQKVTRNSHVETSGYLLALRVKKTLCDCACEAPAPLLDDQTSLETQQTHKSQQCMTQLYTRLFIVALVLLLVEALILR